MAVGVAMKRMDRVALGRGRRCRRRRSTGAGRPGCDHRGAVGDRADVADLRRHVRRPGATRGSARCRAPASSARWSRCSARCRRRPNSRGSNRSVRRRRRSIAMRKRLAITGSIGGTLGSDRLARRRVLPARMTLSRRDLLRLAAAVPGVLRLRARARCRARSARRRCRSIRRPTTKPRGSGSSSEFVIDGLHLNTGTYGACPLAGARCHHSSTCAPSSGSSARKGSTIRRSSRSSRRSSVRGPAASPCCATPPRR